ncbi:unnamed protein product, partial [Mesorhabditis belari]|uniref:Uncharacterized protein n=1 Tax=Mesorhabditis belari TaxID=2138241 RepID=A0AAF3FGZ7_9BILA
MPTPKLHQRDWKEGTVYLFQFPRTHLIPSPSPFSLKLETWLRMNDIAYENISTEFKKTSSKGQVPFIEFNGRQFADSNQIIVYLIKELHKESLDGNLSQQDLAYRQAFHHLLEQSIFWSMVCNRAQTGDWLFSDKGAGSHFSGLKKTLAQKLGPMFFKKKLTSMAHSQGYGRHSIEEIEQQMIKDLDSLSTFLGSKHFFFGDKATTFDATAFGHLCQVVYTPIATAGVLKHIEEQNKNLIDFLERMKANYWPDWNDATENLSFSSNWHKE